MLEQLIKRTSAQHGDQFINEQLGGDHYLLTPKGHLKVLRDDEYTTIAVYNAKTDRFDLTEDFVGVRGRDIYGVPNEVDESWELSPSPDTDPIRPGKAKYPWDWKKLNPKFFNTEPPPQEDTPIKNDLPEKIKKG